MCVFFFFLLLLLLSVVVVVVVVLLLLLLLVLLARRGAGGVAAKIRTGLGSHGGENEPGPSEAENRPRNQRRATVVGWSSNQLDVLCVICSLETHTSVISMYVYMYIYIYIYIYIYVC